MKKQKKNKNKKTQSLPQMAEKKKFNFKLLFLLIINTALVASAYMVAMNYPIYNVVLAIYMVILAAFSIVFVIYNRGFSRLRLTVDMLPDSMSPEEKIEFIEDGEMRLKKSKWMLLVILPLVFTFFLDAFGWFVEDYVFVLFGK